MWRIPSASDLYLAYNIDVPFLTPQEFVSGKRQHCISTDEIEIQDTTQVQFPIDTINYKKKNLVVMVGPQGAGNI